MTGRRRVSRRDYVLWCRCGRRLWAHEVNFCYLTWHASPEGLVRACPDCGRALPAIVADGWTNGFSFDPPAGAPGEMREEASSTTPR